MMLVNEQDDKLSQLLREWNVEVSLPPRFQEQVWKRIARAEAQAQPALWQVFRHWVETAFSRPALAVSYVALLLVTGLSAGYWHAQDVSARSESRWRTLYVQSIDPYQAPR